MYRLEVSRTAHGQIRKLPAQARERVEAAIARLAADPRPPGVKKLAAREGYRIRVGDYRILYSVDDAAKLIVVYRVMPRQSAYHDPDLSASLLEAAEIARHSSCSECLLPLEKGE